MWETQQEAIPQITPNHHIYGINQPQMVGLWRFTALNMITVGFLMDTYRTNSMEQKGDQLHGWVLILSVA